MKHGEGEPDDQGCYAAMVNGGWKILEWVGSAWSYPGTPIIWPVKDVSQWFGPLPPETPVKEYDL